MIAAHPRLFSSGRTPLYPSDLPSGWFDLAHNTLEHIEKTLTNEEIDTVMVSQIKEKWGTLHMSITGPSEREVSVQDILDAAEEASRQVCLTCGRPGIWRDGLWTRTLCDEHEVAYQRYMTQAGSTTSNAL